MIDGFIMRDPGSYEDIIDILMDERVISEEDGQGMKEIILLRKMLTQDYIQMNHDELYKTIQKHIAVVEKYPANIRSYLEKELYLYLHLYQNNMLIRSPENAFWGSYIVCERKGRRVKYGEARTTKDEIVQLLKVKESTR